MNGCPPSPPDLYPLHHIIFHRIEFTQLAADYKAVNLGQGFPDFAPPKFIQDAFCEAVGGGCSMHQYTRAFVSCFSMDTQYASILPNVDFPPKKCILVYLLYRSILHLHLHLGHLADDFIQSDLHLLKETVIYKTRRAILSALPTSKNVLYAKH